MAQPTIPGYSIEDRLGSGGFATVYLATDDETGGKVAIKVLHDHTNNPSDLRRFEREQTTMHALNGHPNIVGILTSGTTEDEQHFTVLEYVGGGSVRDGITSGGALHWANVVEIGVQICAALDIAHRSGVLHRDVKPGNILLDDNIAKLGDFGIARLIGQSQVTAAQSIIGTLAYTPPEVFHNKPFDGRGDIYQLGVSLYEMLLGRAPFTSAAADNKATVIRRILDHPAPPLAQFDVPQPLSDLLDEVLAKDPADRPQTAESFGRRLNEVEVELGKTPTSIGQTTQPIAVETHTITAPTGEHGEVWPRASAEHDLDATALSSRDTPAPADVPESAKGAVPFVPIEEPEFPLATIDASEIASAGAATNAVPIADPEVPDVPEVDPPFDANVTVVEQRPANATSVLSGGTQMSLGTPGPAPAHFEAPAASQRAPANQPRPTPAQRRRRWPWALLALALIGAGGAGVAAARWSNNTTEDPTVEATGDGEPEDENVGTPDRIPQLVAMTDAAFLEPDSTHGVIFDVVRNDLGLTMVGGAGDGESAGEQQPVIWTIDSDEVKMQRAFDRGGRIWSMGVINNVDFLAVGDTADGAGETDGISLIGDRAATLANTSDETFTGPENDALYVSVFDPSSSPPGFLVGGRRSSDGAATMGLWEVARPSPGEPPEWQLVLPVSTGNPGAINDIAVNGDIAVAVGTEQIDGIDVGVILVRRGDNWSDLIKPLPDTIFHGVTIAGDRIVAVGETGTDRNSRTPIAIVSNAQGQRPLLHKLPVRLDAGIAQGVARDVAEVANGRVVIVGDTANPDDSNGRIGAIWELLRADDFTNDKWTTRATADLPTDSFTELRAITEFDDTIYIFGRTEIDDGRPAGAWTLSLDSE